MNRLFMLVSNMDKPLIDLKMLSNTEIVCKCGKKLASNKVTPHLFICLICHREYMGPTL
jgi:hypothetical protein